jgi:hypothetical protein
MRKGLVGINCLLVALTVTFMAGCGEEVATGPTVVSTIPANGATGVAVTTPISATFSTPMNPATLTAATFKVTGPGGTAVAGTITTSGLTATFTPTAALAFGSVYSATITSAVDAMNGAYLTFGYGWTFTTVAAPPVPPTVIATVAANGATGVPVNQAVSATFSTAMNCATLASPAATFTLAGPGTTAVAGTVTCAGSTATFTPAAGLAIDTLYTATITTGAQNSANTPLAANYVWTFTTIAPPPTVTTAVPGNGATGVPVTQAPAVTFSEPMNCDTLSSPATTFTLAGPGATAVAGTASCAGSTATFTPAAALAVNTVYTATITTGAQNSANTPMAANYVWTFRTAPASAVVPPTVISTVPANGAVGVPINQALTATFSVAMIPTTINTTTFTLSSAGGGAVTGVVTYIAAGSVAIFQPAANLLPSTVYTATITTGAMDLPGTALAQNYVWTFTTGAAAVNTVPTVTSTIPLNGAVGVPLNQIVSATFSTAMNPATLNSATFTLTGPGATAVTGLVAYASVGNTLTFTPSANLAANTLFTATITTGAQNLEGTALAANYVWTFTTGAAVAAIAPEVVSTIPANAAAGVALNQAVSATFTEAMNPLTITTATFELTGPGGTAVAGTVSYDPVNYIATFTPAAPLTASVTYTAIVTDGATDLNGNPLGNTGAPNPWMFGTGPAILAPPVVLGPTISLFGGFGGGVEISGPRAPPAS